MTLTFAVLVAALGVAVPTAASDTLPQGGGANNVVVAQTSTDGAAFARSALQLSTVGGPSVTSANIATATATACVACRATAVAVQVVLVSGTPWYFAPANFAAATNGGCSACGTFAFAWQYVLQVDRAVALDPAAQREVAALRSEIAATASAYDPADLEQAIAMDGALDALTDELKAVVDGAVASAGAHGYGEPVEHVNVAPVS